MTTVNDVYKFLCKLAPIEMKVESDNVGFLVGSAETKVTKILVALDITNDVISESVEHEAQLVVSHHPLFFYLNSITDSDLTGKKIVRMLENHMSAICMHTNLDAAGGGVGDALAEAAGIADNGDAELLTRDNMLPSGEVYSMGRVGYLNSPSGIQEYLKMLKQKLGTNGIRYYDAGREVYKVAVMGGSGSSMFPHVVRHGCDTFVSADLKYNIFLEAKELGINLIDADHFCTENLIIPVLAKKLSEKFPHVQTIVSDTHKQVVSFF